MAALLARRETEGLSLRAIAEDAGIPFGTLSWWSWRLRQDPTPALDAEGGFVELVATAQSEPSAADLVVALGNGVDLRVRRGTDVDWLREVVVALRTC